MLLHFKQNFHFANFANDCESRDPHHRRREKHVERRSGDQKDQSHCNSQWIQQRDHGENKETPFKHLVQFILVLRQTTSLF